MIACSRGFFEFASAPDQESLDQLSCRLGELAQTGPTELRDVFGLAQAGAETFHRHSNIGTFRDTLDVQFTSVFTSVGKWHQKLPDRFEVRHDSSSNFFRQREIWETLAAPDIPPQMHEFAAGVLQFPLRVDSIEPVDSRDSAAVQLADIVAGSVARLYASGINGDFKDELVAEGFGELTLSGVRPGNDFIDGPPPLREGPDVVDALADIFLRGRAV